MRATLFSNILHFYQQQLSVKIEKDRLHTKKHHNKKESIQKSYPHEIQTEAKSL